MQQPTVTLSNGVIMPQLGLGVWNAKDGDETRDAVNHAIEAGYRLIDTAAVYGNEKGVGDGIAASGIDRSELFVTTKVWNSDQGYETTLAAFDASLKRLGLDYIDLYLIHWPTPARDLYQETWRALETLYREGRVRAIGVCNFLPEHLDHLAETATITPMINQIELNPYFPQKETRNYCQQHTIQVESWSPLGGPSGGKSELRLLEQPILANIAETHHKTPAQVVIRWHLQHGLVVIPKSVHKERIRENADVFDFELSDEELSQIDSLATGVRGGPDPATMNNH